MADLIGQSFGRYHILEQLGEGGMATVYKAYDTRLERVVAVKVIRTERLAPEILGKAIKRFEREAKALAKLSHPNIVKVIDFGEYEGKPFLVMEYLPGGTLKQKLKNDRFPYQQAAQLLIPIARALAYAHDQGIIHRDVKPSNILIAHSGETMLSDFGVAKILEIDETAELTATGIGVGTPEYMAPEQIQGGGIDRRADIYALGVILYEAVTGRKPYQADTPAAIIWKQASEPLPRPGRFISNLPDQVENIIMKALAKNPKDRYQNMEVVAQALQQLITQRKKEPAVKLLPSVPKHRIPKIDKIALSRGENRVHLSRRNLLIVGIGIIAILGLSFLFSDGLHINRQASPPVVSSASETPTPTIIPTATSTQTITPTPSITPSPTPGTITGAVLFEDDFEHELSRGWVSQGTLWGYAAGGHPGDVFGSIRETADNQVLLWRTVYGQGWAIRPNGADHWQNYAVSLRFNMISGPQGGEERFELAVRANIRTNIGCNRFLVNFVYPGTIDLQADAFTYSDTANCFASYGGIHQPLNENTWYNYRIEVFENTVSIYNNDQLIRKVQNASVMPGEGYVLLNLPPNSEMYIDDVKIVELLPRK